MTKLQTWVMTGLGTLALLVGALLASGAITSAQSPTPTPSTTEDTTDDGTTPTPDASGDSGSGHWCGGGANPLAFDNAGEILGMTQAELREAKQSGQTLAEIAVAQGMTAEDFQAALVAAVTADLQTQLDAGDITQEEFDTATTNLSDKINAIINSEGGFHGHGRHLINVLSAAADVLGVDEITLEDGQTLGEFAEAQGMSVEDFKAALTANITSDLQAKLDAGEITQEQFDDKVANLSDKLDDIINAEGGLRFRGPGPGFDGGTRFRFAPQSDNTNAGTDA